VSRRLVIWIIPALLTVHNAEEAIAFRSYLPRVPGLLPPSLAGLAARLTYAAMVQTLTVLSVLVFVLAFVVDARPGARKLFWLLLAVEAAVGLNGIAHLLSATVVFRGYAPGLVTALLLNVPFAAYCFRRAQREQWVSSTALWATIPAAFVLHGPVLFAGLWLAAKIA
jgi:hypothetical protein